MRSALDETRLVDVLEAAYALEGTDEEWLTRTLSAVKSVCGDECNYTGFVYDASSVEALQLRSFCRLQTPPPELARVWEIFRSIATPEVVRQTLLSVLAGAARTSAPPSLRPLLAERERNGHGDFYFLNGLDPSGVGCAMTLGCRTPVLRLRPKDTAVLRRVATHLGAAYRARRRLGLTRPGAADPAPGPFAAPPEAVLDGSHRVVHADGPAKSRVARERLRGAATAIDAARTRAGRSRGAAALGAWHPLVGARWTLVDTFEEGGRRFVVAHENQSEPAGLSVLTDRERQVVAHAALGLTTKEVGYALGISDTTVRVLLARAARRLGVRSRKELLVHPLLRGMPRAPPGNGLP